MRRITFFITFVCALFLLGANVNAIGLSPSPIIINNVANGVRIPKTVTIMRSSKEGNMLIEVQTSGDNARYLELSKTSFVISEGYDRVDYTFYVSPKNATNGTHEAKILFIKKSDNVDLTKKITGSGATVTEAVGARVVFEIVDHEVLEYKILGAALNDTEVGMSIPFTFHVVNLGNVDVKLDKIEVNLVDETDVENKFSFVLEKDGIDFIGPGIDKNFTYDFTDKFRQGVYQGGIKFFVNGQIVQKANNLRVVVHPPGTLGQSAEFVNFTAEKENYVKGELARFFGQVKNTGQVAVKSVLYVEIWRDGQRLDLLRSSDKMVLKGQTGEFDLDYRFEDSGQYLVKGYFENGAVKTNAKEININIPTVNVVGQKNTWIVGSVVLLVIVLILIVIIVWRRHSHKNSHYIHHTDHHKNIHKKKKS